MKRSRKNKPQSNEYLERYSSTSTLDIYSKNTGLKGLFVLDENGLDKRKLKIEDEYLCASVSFLEFFDKLIKTPNSREWIDGITYLIDFLRYEKDSKARKRFKGSDPIANAHAKAFSSRSLELATQSAARALVLLCHMDEGQYNLNKEGLKQQFSIIGEGVGEQVHASIEQILVRSVNDSDFF